MNYIKKLVLLLAVIFVATSITACSPDVGSPDWCADMKEKPKGDWTANEAADFAKSCLL